MAQQSHCDVVRVGWQRDAQAGARARGNVHLTFVERGAVGAQPQRHTCGPVGVVGNLDESGLGAPVRVHTHLQLADCLVVRPAADGHDLDRHDLTVAIGRRGDLSRGQGEGFADGRSARPRAGRIERVAGRSGATAGQKHRIAASPYQTDPVGRTQTSETFETAGAGCVEACRRDVGRLHTGRRIDDERQVLGRIGSRRGSGQG